MHPLTKEERKGAISIAMLSLLICGGAALYGVYQRNREMPNENELVESIILMADSSASQSQQSDDRKISHKEIKSGKGSRGKSEKRKSSPKKGNGKDKEKKNKSTPPPRDFLSDPV